MAAIKPLRRGLWTPCCQALVALAIFLGPTVALPANRKAGDDSGTRRGPRILLSASPSFGFAPLSVQLVATLSGVETHDPNFCHAGITWIRVDPGSSPETETRLSELPKCIHGDEEISVATSFSKSFDLNLPGSYLYRVIVGAKDGTQVKSNFVTVRVLRIP